METTLPSHTPMQAKPLSELLPGIRALLSQSTVLIHSSKKPSSIKVGQACTTEKYKPMTIAEIRQGLRGPSPKKVPQTTSSKQKRWNSSAKVDKSKTLTKNGLMKHSTARKVLDFQPKTKGGECSRQTMIPPLTRKSIYSQAKAATCSRMSGVSHIAPTPVINKPFLKVPDLKLNSVSFKSNDDDSFLQKEKELEMSLPASTPFKCYRNVKDYFNCSEVDNSDLYHDNTIMTFEKPQNETINNSKHEESVINTICETLNKTTITNGNVSKEINHLSELLKQTENDIKIIDNVFKKLNVVYENKHKILEDLNKLKHTNQQNGAKNVSVLVVSLFDDKIQQNELNIIDVIKVLISMMGQNKLQVKETKANLAGTCIETTRGHKDSPDKSPITSRPIIKKSPSSKISRKGISLTKKVFFKPAANILNEKRTPTKNNDKALSMYMQIKEQMTFLNTPLTKPRTEIPDTPAVTSDNLQKQLNKLFN